MHPMLNLSPYQHTIGSLIPHAAGFSARGRAMCRVAVAHLPSQPLSSDSTVTLTIRPRDSLLLHVRDRGSGSSRFVRVGKDEQSEQAGVRSVLPPSLGQRGFCIP